MDFGSFFSTLPEPIQALLLGGAGDFLGGIAGSITIRLADKLGYKAQERLRPKPRQVALNQAMAQALYETFRRFTVDETELTHYLTIFGQWTESERVAGELSQLIDPQRGAEIDLSILVTEFEELGYDPDNLGKGISFEEVVREFARSFYDAASEQKELKGVIEIGLLRGLVEQLSDVAEATQRTAVATESMAQGFNDLTNAILGLLPAVTTEHNAPGVLHNLPQPNYERFIGRHQEIESVQKLLSADTRHFVITIDGSGGIGKTALVLKVAYDYLHKKGDFKEQDSFDAIIWTTAKQRELTGDGITIRHVLLKVLEDIYGTIAVTLRRKDILNAPQHQQADLVRQALTQQRTLLIIDNLETVDDDRLLNFIHDVPPPTKVIVTTRHRLDVAYPVRLTEMPWEDINKLIVQECESKAVMIDEVHAKRLFERTGGIPLAVKWSVAQIAFGHNIEVVLFRLGESSTDVTRYCFEGAIELIRDRPAYKLLMALSAFDGGASREALGYITELSDVDRDEGLVDLEKLSLVNKTESHFSMLPLTLTYCRTELAQDKELEEHFKDRQTLFLQSFLLPNQGGLPKRTLDVISSFGTISQLEAEERLSLEDANRLRLAGFYIVKRLTSTTPNEAETAVLNHLLPLCVAASDKDSSEVTAFRRRCREILGDWLEQYAQQEHFSLREKVISYLREYLKSSDVRPVCWTISRVGYRDQELQGLLWRIVGEQDSEQGDTALATLLDLGVSGEEYGKATRILVERVARRANFALRHVALKLSDPTCVTAIQSNWLEPIEQDKWHDFPSYALYVLAEIADKYHEDNELQDQIWSYLAGLFEDYPDTLETSVLLSSGLGPQCNSPNVVQSFLTWLGANNIKDYEVGEHQRWLIYQRLQQCVRPNQLLGWSYFDGLQVETALKQDALSDTKHKGLSLTMEGQRKKLALDCLIRLGYKSSLDWFEGGVNTETSPFMQQALCDHYACYRIEPLPQTIIEWIVEPFDWKTSDKSTFEYARRLGAIRVAASSASEESFKALVNFGFTADGNVLLDSATALASVASALFHQNVNVVDKLIEKATHSQEIHQRICCTWALEMLAIQGLLSEEEAEALVSLTSDSQLRSTIVSILGHVQKASVPESLINEVRNWALGNDEWLAQRSLEFLARRNLLMDDYSLIEKKLHLQHQNGHWHLSTHRHLPDWAGYIISILYSQNPTAFSSVLSTLIRTQEWRVVYPVLKSLEFAIDVDKSVYVTNDVVDSLIQRVKTRHKQNAADPDTLNTIATLAPEWLITSISPDDWSDWIPAARQALADSIGEIRSKERSIIEKASKSLVALTQDNQFRVRRPAYRALGKLDFSSLQALCISLANSESVQLRERAAEAIAWMPISETSDEIYEELYKLLRSDSERTVRTKAINAYLERRQRYWANTYITKVLEVTGHSNDEIFSAGCYGQALIKVGDDTTLKLLRQHLEKNVLWPNVKHWISQIIKELEKEWQKTTRKWPEPFIAFSGAIAENNGYLKLRQNPLEVKFSLWTQPAHSPSAFSSWGGVAWVEDSSELVGASQIPKIQIELEDGRAATILPTLILNNALIFLGQAHYPEDVSHQITAEGR